MLEYEITSTKECIISGIGVFTAGETKSLDEDVAQRFKLLYGYPLSAANFPPSITLTTIVGEEE
jgi:hypothetical protein